MSMLGLLNGNSELTANEVISGLGEVELDALLGEINALPTSQKAAAIKRIAGSGAVKGRGTSREEFIKRISTISPEISRNIAAGNMRLADVILYATKNVGSKTTIKMLVDDDNKVPDVTNISSGKLEKDNVLLLDSITLLAGVGASDADPFDVAMDIIPAAIRNGEFILKANGGEIIPLSSLEVFNTTNMTCPKGEFRLANPVLVQTQKSMAFEAEWGAAAAAKTWMRLILRGTIAYKK